MLLSSPSPDSLSTFECRITAFRPGSGRGYVEVLSIRISLVVLTGQPSHRKRFGHNGLLAIHTVRDCERCFGYVMIGVPYHKTMFRSESMGPFGKGRNKGLLGSSGMDIALNWVVSGCSFSTLTVKRTSAESSTKSATRARRRCASFEVTSVKTTREAT